MNHLYYGAGKNSQLEGLRTQRMNKCSAPLVTLLFLPMVLIACAGGAGVKSNKVAHSDLNKGEAAYNRGDYATAYREFRALAEQGDVTSQYVRLNRATD